MTVQIKRIGDCADILPGLSLKARAEHEPDGTYQIIQAKHLKEGIPYVFNRKEHELRITIDKKMDRYLVNAGDILFISRGMRNEAILVDEVPEHSVASSSFYIIRGKQGVETGYLAWVLEQSQIKAKVAQARTGAGMPLVQRSELMEMTIPVPDINTQLKISELNRLMANERRILDQINEQTKCLHQSVGAQLFKDMNLG
jgi:restriction endonuclease S subunit